VNPLRWRDKDRANVMVSAAGIIVNTLIAICAFVVIKVLLMTGWWFTEGSLQEPVKLILQMFLTMNISLAVFNLLPFPPLDGSKILETFLPASAQPILTLMEQYGFIILMMLIYVGFFGAILTPIMGVVYYLLLLGVNG
jgi:Zn-dependent protease